MQTCIRCTILYSIVRIWGVFNVKCLHKLPKKTYLILKSAFREVKSVFILQANI